MSNSAPALLGYPHWSFSTPVSTQYTPVNNNNAAAEIHSAAEALPGDVAPAGLANAAFNDDNTPAMTVASSDLGSVYTPSTPDRARSLPTCGRFGDDHARNEREEVRLFNAAVKVMDMEALKMVLRACIKDARPQKKKARALYERVRRQKERARIVANGYRAEPVCDRCALGNADHLCYVDREDAKCARCVAFGKPCSLKKPAHKA